MAHRVPMHCLEHRVRFELTAFRICNPVHWASLAPVHCETGGDEKIRTSGTLLVYDGLANHCLRPLGHVSMFLLYSDRALLSIIILVDRGRVELPMLPCHGRVIPFN